MQSADWPRTVRVGVGNSGLRSVRFKPGAGPKEGRALGGLELAAGGAGQRNRIPTPPQQYGHFLTARTSAPLVDKIRQR